MIYFVSGGDNQNPGRRRKNPDSNQSKMSITVVIYADSLKIIGDAIKMIEHEVESEFKERIFKDRIIKEFSPTQVFYKCSYSSYMESSCSCYSNRLLIVWPMIQDSAWFE